MVPSRLVSLLLFLWLGSGALGGWGCRRAVVSPQAGDADMPTDAVVGDDADSARVADAAPGDAWPLFRGTPACSGIAVGNAERVPHIEWVYSAEKDGFTASPIVAGDSVYLGGNNGTFYAVSVETGRLAWKQDIGGGFLAAAAFHAGRVYVGDVDGKFFAWNAEDGKPLWQFEAEGTIDNAANVFSAGDRPRILFGSQDMNLYCLDAETGSVVWRTALPDQIRCQPPVAEDRAFVAGCDGKLHSLELLTGKELGTCDLDGPTGCTPAVMGGELYVGTESGFFFGIDWKTGRRLWQFPPERPADAFRSSAAVCGPFVVVGCRDRQIYCFHAATGETAWKFAARRYVDASPVIVVPENGDLAQAVVVVGSLDGRLHGLRLQDGSPKWELDLGGAVSASAAVVGRRIFAATEEGDLYCLGLAESASP
ncbi:MAG: PQQ-binding-like beta-propeller repeat protein [Thermogutta sp.]|nr:PQQ-binding-like beta-propeller repeat protein [Thermogutta sp.]